MRKLCALFLFTCLLGTLGCMPKPKQQKIAIAPVDVDPPETLREVTIAVRSVTDERTFTAQSETASDQSLATVETIEDVDTSEAVAQLRAANGAVLFDFFAHKDITDIVKNVVEEAFEGAGYQIANADASNAVPVDVNIERFWAYDTGGTWAFSFIFDIDIVVQGEIPTLTSGKHFTSSITLHSGWEASRRSFENTINKGLQKFLTEMQSELQQAG